MVKKLPPRYVLTARRVAQAQGDNSLTRHSLVDGVRYLTRGGFLERSYTATDPPLVGLARLPEHLGNGFVFWNRRALFRAQTFTGELTPLADVGAQPERVTFGPDYLLVQTGEGRWVIDAKTGARKPSGISGLVDVAAVSDGRALALTSTGDALYSRDSGKHWTSVHERLTSPIRELREHEGDLWLVELSGEALLLDASGRITRHAAPKVVPRTPVDPRWPSQQTPLETAAGAGVMLEDGRALVAANGALATIDLESGELGLHGRAIVPAGSECRLLPTSSELLLVCSGAAVTVIRDPLNNPRVERSFDAGSSISFAESMLVIGASCEGDRELGQLCVRDDEGEYKGFDRKIEIAALAEAKPNQVLGQPPNLADFSVDWVPKRGGGAIGIVSRPKPALIDAMSGALVLLPKERSADILAIVENTNKPVVTSRVASEQGVILGYGRTRSFKLLKDGKLVPNAFSFSILSGFDRRALAVDSAQHYFESEDFGQTWQQVESPPGTGGPEACSEVGCRSSNWLRLGWGAAPPKEQPPARVIPSPAFYEAPKRPLLDCRERGAPALSTRTPSVAPDGQSTNDFGFGARQVLLSTENSSFFREVFGALNSTSYGLWAMIYARTPEIVSTNSGVVPASPAEQQRKKAIYSVRAFDPKGTISTSGVSWKTQAEAALRVGGSLPNLQASDQEEGTVFPVATAPPRYADGLLLKEPSASAIWLRDQRDPIKAVSLGNARDEFEILDAVSPAHGDLVLLSIDDEEQAHVIAITKEGILQLLEYPVKPSALAVDAHGEVALFFAPAGVEPPSADDPAMILRPRGTPQRLAPWSTLKPASAPECAPADDDFRVLVRAKRSWLGVVQASNAQSSTGEVPEMLALVRANATRFCLEAVELTAPSVDSGDFSVETRIVARFADGLTAGRVGIGLGVEFRQPLSCEVR